jgi:hypothetical protein
MNGNVTLKRLTAAFLFIVALAVTPMFFLAGNVVAAEELHLTIYRDAGSDEIVYDRKEEINVSLMGGAPDFEVVDAGSCGPVAASMALAYYDYRYPDIIPNHEPYIFHNGGCYYNWQYPPVKEVERQLSADMKRKEGKGVTNVQFQNGVEKYLNRLGLRAEFNTVMNQKKVLWWTEPTTFNYKLYKEQINLGRPVILGLAKFHQTFITTLDTPDGRKKDVFGYVAPAAEYTAAHCETGFGYREILYYKTKEIWGFKPLPDDPFNMELVRTYDIEIGHEAFLLVGTGHGTATYLNIARHFFEVNDAFGLNVYA